MLSGAMPGLRVVSDHPARRAALAALWPEQNTDEQAEIALIDATEALPALPDLPCLVLSPTRPEGLPAHARWLAAPARAETIAAALSHWWKERPRALGAYTLTLQPPRLSGPESVPLTEKEAHLLAALIGAPEGLPRAELLAQWWGMGESADTHALETQLYRLRQKLKPLFGEGLELGLQKGVCRLTLG